MSQDIDLADEIVTVLNGQTWAIPFTAERDYVPDWNVKTELGELRCAVIPESRTGAVFERTTLQKEFSIVVFFAQRLLEKTRDELDALMNLVESVTNFICPDDGEPTVVTVTATGLKYINTGFEDRIRFHPDELKREVLDGTKCYTGSFLAGVAFPFELYMP